MAEPLLEIFPLSFGTCISHSMCDTQQCLGRKSQDESLTKDSDEVDSAIKEQTSQKPE